MSGPSTVWTEGDDGRDLVAGSLRGYRTWRLLARSAPFAPGTLPLTSVTRQHVRWPTVLSASCNSADLEFARAASVPAVPDHRSPAAGCTCGIYAWYTPADAKAFFTEVFGAVEASGLVLLGTQGFRAEHARITAIATRNRRLAAACADAGVPVYRRRRDLVAAHPPDDVSTLLGEPPRPRSRHPHGFALVICLSVWLRAALLMVAAGLFPLAAIVASVILSEVAVIALVVMYLRTMPARPGGAVSPNGAPLPDP